MIPRVEVKSQASNFWRGICLTWPDVLKGIRWNVGDGLQARFWLDKWLHLGIIL